jgi:hypothetical protein
MMLDTSTWMEEMRMMTKSRDFCGRFMTVPSGSKGGGQRPRAQYWRSGSRFCCKNLRGHMFVFGM